MTDRTDKQTFYDKQGVFFSDFLTNFNKHPATGELARVVNSGAIKQSIKNLVLTSYGERLYQPTIGGNVPSSLFEPLDNFTINYISDSIKQTIFNNEPRVASCKVTVIPNFDDNSYEATIEFTERNSVVIQSVDLILIRNR